MPNPNYRIGPKMRAAMQQCFTDHQIELRDYLRTETNRGVSDIKLGAEFDVDRHTIQTWKTVFGLITQRRAVDIRR